MEITHFKGKEEGRKGILGRGKNGDCQNINGQQKF